VDNGVENNDQGKKVAEVKKGSVTIAIFKSQNSVRVLKKPLPGMETVGQPEYEIKQYDSFIVPYYEGSIRKTPRRSTIEKATKLAEEVAERLNREGAKAAFFSEKDRRIFILAKAAAAKIGMEVDELCRKFVELQTRLKTGTLDQAVGFFNDHGQRVKHGVANTVIFKDYLDHLEQRGAGVYHTRDVKRFAGPFISAFSGSISPITTADIDKYLQGLKKTKEKKRKKKNKARTYNNVRDAIIGYFNFAQEKGYLPQGIPHAASLTTEFRDVRKKIESEKDALELLQPNDIYTVEEMRKILAAAKEHYPEVLPTLEIKAFSGVRTEEMVRLWWVMVCEDEEIIRIPDAVGKVDARRVGGAEGDHVDAGEFAADEGHEADLVGDGLEDFVARAEVLVAGLVHVAHGRGRGHAAGFDLEFGDSVPDFALVGFGRAARFE
jgi:hypothetical protein